MYVGDTSSHSPELPCDLELICELLGGLGEVRRCSTFLLRIRELIDLQGARTMMAIPGTLYVPRKANGTRYRIGCVCWRLWPRVALAKDDAIAVADAAAGVVRGEGGYH